jgi:hypothetical protein
MTVSLLTISAARVHVLTLPILTWCLLSSILCVAQGYRHPMQGGRIVSMDIPLSWRILVLILPQAGVVAASVNDWQACDTVESEYRHV